MKREIRGMEEAASTEKGAMSEQVVRLSLTTFTGFKILGWGLDLAGWVFNQSPTQEKTIQQVMVTFSVCQVVSEVYGYQICTL